MRILIINLTFFVTSLLTASSIFAHNGKVAYARPVAPLKIDGDFSDWPKNLEKYLVQTTGSETKPEHASDFSGFFQIGYNLSDQSLYVAITIRDDQFIEDTSDKVSFNSQDCLELCIDARHIRNGSGVASFMYSKKLRNINRSFYDAFAKDVSWDMMEVAMVRKGDTRFYEWRIKLGDELKVGKSMGFDFQVFDKDNDGSFSFSSWGKGGFKFRNPDALGDVIPVGREEKLGTIQGKLAWQSAKKPGAPNIVHVSHLQNTALWFDVEPDSLDTYNFQAPAGEYNLVYAGDYFMSGDTLLESSAREHHRITIKPGQTKRIKELHIGINNVPDLIPARGILHNFTDADAARVDEFITTYQKYYNIPGVSLALIKDGKLVYHQTYGVRNSLTREPVGDYTLFEAASITKPVFAFAVQRLAERGVIDLDKPLYQYLPYPDIAHDERYKLITAKHVLIHRSGFPNWRWMNPDGKLNILFTPGTKYNYSGEGFEYLKLVVEKLTGKKVEQVLKEEVIDPMELNHTFFSKNDSLVQLAATGHYDMLPNRKDYPEQPGMAYSMFTEARVFTNFMLYLLEQKGLRDETYQTMLSKQTEYVYDSTDKKPKDPTYMGMSLEIRETPFGKSFGHGGNNGDFKCRFEVFKDLKMGYAIFTNSNTSDVLLYNGIGKFLIEGK